MSGSYRHILVALAGLAAITTSLGIGYYSASLNYPQEQRYQPYRYAADKPLEIDRASPDADAQPLEYREPCEQPKGNDESDLCAQWRAAKAAENSAFWTKWGFWITGFGIVGLLITIVQGRVALQRARDANEIARDTANKQLRAYVDIDDVETHFDRRPDWDKNGMSYYKMRMPTKNFGQTPARNVRLYFDIKCSAYPQTFTEFTINKDAETVFDIPPDGVYTRIIPYGADPKIIQMIANEEAALFIFFHLIYDDIFGDEHFLKYVATTHGGLFRDGQLAVKNGTYTAS